MNDPLITHDSKIIRRLIRISQRLAGGQSIRCAFLYGQFTIAPTRAHDIDLLIVLRSGLSSYARSKVLGKQLNAHIVSFTQVVSDVCGDAYGWMFLTKLLSPHPTVLLGNLDDIDELRAMAHSRLLGQWCAEHPADRSIRAKDLAPHIIDVLTRWNPQSESLFAHRKEFAPSIQRYVSQEYPSSKAARCLFPGIRSDGRSTLRVDRHSRWYRGTDLRRILLLYWGYYLAYKLDPAYYLDKGISVHLRRKGVMPHANTPTLRKR